MVRILFSLGVAVVFGACAMGMSLGLLWWWYDLGSPDGASVVAVPIAVVQSTVAAIGVAIVAGVVAFRRRGIAARRGSLENR